MIRGIVCVYKNEKDQLAVVKAQLDNYNHSTQELLTAIYGGISDQYELKEFLRSNSPLSNEVLRAYMERYNVPAEYYKQIIEANGELDLSLHDLLKSKTASMPDAIADEIRSLSVNNPYQESVADIEQRVQALEKAYHKVFFDRVRTFYVNDQGPELLDYLDNRNNTISRVMKIEYLLNIGDYFAVESALNSLTQTDTYMMDWKTEMELATNIMRNSRTFKDLTSHEKETLKEFIYAGPENPASSEAKAYFGIDAEILMLIPVPSNVTRSYQLSLLDLDPKEFEPRVYPNPTSNYIRIKMPMSKEINADFMIYDVSGKLILSESFNSSYEDALIELQELSKGAYTYQIVYNNVNYSDKLIIK